MRKGTICYIPEYYINNILYRHEELENFGVYELTMNFEFKKITHALKQENESKWQ